MPEPDTTIPAEGQPVGQPAKGADRDLVPGEAAPGPGADVSRDPDVYGGGEGRAAESQA